MKRFLLIFSVVLALDAALPPASYCYQCEKADEECVTPELVHCPQATDSCLRMKQSPVSKSRSGNFMAEYRCTNNTRECGNRQAYDCELCNTTGCNTLKKFVCNQCGGINKNNSLQECSQIGERECFEANPVCTSMRKGELDYLDCMDERKFQSICDKDTSMKCASCKVEKCNQKLKKSGKSLKCHKCYAGEVATFRPVEGQPAEPDCPVIWCKPDEVCFTGVDINGQHHYGCVLDFNVDDKNSQSCERYGFTRCELCRYDSCNRIKKNVEINNPPPKRQLASSAIGIREFSSFSVLFVCCFFRFALF